MNLFFISHHRLHSMEPGELLFIKRKKKTELHIVTLVLTYIHHRYE